MPFPGFCVYTSIACSFDTCLTYGITSITRFWPVRIRTIHYLYLGAQSASMKYPDRSKELRLLVAWTISCKFQMPIGQRHIARHKDKMSWIVSNPLESNYTWGLCEIKVNCGGDNSELISETSRPGDRSPTKSITNNWNEFRKNSQSMNRGIHEII